MSISRLEKSFSNSFDFISLQDILKYFNGVSTVSDIISKLPFLIKDYTIDIIVWLLR
jgi:hypothetical protein